MAPRWVRSSESSPVVCDLGSSTLKCGFAGDDSPRAVFPSVVGRLRGNLPVGSLDPVYFADEALSKRGVLNLRHPVAQGCITYWDDAEALWQHAFYDHLQIAPEQHPVLLTEDPVPPRANREKLTQVMFETFSVPAMYVAVQSVLSLYSTGRTTGVVLESGHDTTYAVPVFDGYSLQDAVMNRAPSGREVTYQLASLLHKRGYSYDLVRRTARDMKEKLAYVALDYEKELEAAKNENEKENSISSEKTYKLPDGEEIALGSASFACLEVLFNPSMMGATGSGVHELTYSSIMACERSIRRELFSSIVLSGGGTTHPGMAQRLAKEVAILADNTRVSAYNTRVSAPPESGGAAVRSPDSSFRVNVIAPPDPRYAAWVGGCMLASLSTFQQLWISRGEYDEFGPSIVHRKCF